MIPLWASFYNQNSAPIPLLLDTYPAQGAWSFSRKLRTAYAGSCIRVRRSSDSTELDIGFVGNELDTSSLLTFAGAGNAFVTTAYEQSGLGVNAAQATTTAQPRIVNAGVLDTQNGKPCAVFDGVDDCLMLTGGAALALFQNVGWGFAFTVAQSSVTTAVNRSIFYASTGTNAAAARLQTGTSSTTAGRYRVEGRTLDADSPINGTYTISYDTALHQNLALLAWSSPGTISGYFDQVTAFSGAVTTANTSNTASLVMGIGCRNSTNYWNGGISEVIVYNTDQSSNVTAISTNQKTFFGTP